MNTNRTSSFMARDELRAMGFRSVGDHVLISRNACFYKPEAIIVGNHVRIDDFCMLSGGQGIFLGNHIHIGCYCALYGGSGIVMEDFTTLSARASLYSESDDFTGASMTSHSAPKTFKPGYQAGPVILRRHAIVGANCTVMPGVTLQEGAAVGAHSLVRADCEAWSIYFGVPARRRGARMKALLELERRWMGGHAERLSAEEHPHE